MPVITARNMHPGKDILVTWRSRGTRHTLKGHINLLSITKGCRWRGELLWYGPFCPGSHAKTARKSHTDPEINLWSSLKI